jgi:hypothetical protein
VQTTNIAKMVSKEWREMQAEEREFWDEKSRNDKARYEAEMLVFNEARKSSKRTKKDPDAPKRPMSAFLAFSNKRRAALKRENPNATNADLSKMLSKTWKEVTPEFKASYIDEEAKLRAKYKVNIVAWRKKKSEEMKAAVANNARQASLNEGVMPPTGADPTLQQRGNQPSAATNAAYMASFGAAGNSYMQQLGGYGAMDGSGRGLVNNSDLLGSFQGGGPGRIPGPGDPGFYGGGSGFSTDQFLNHAAAQQQFAQLSGTFRMNHPLVLFASVFSSFHLFVDVLQLRRHRIRTGLQLLAKDRIYKDLAKDRIYKDSSSKC